VIEEKDFGKAIAVRQLDFVIENQKPFEGGGKDN
jgi:hypothetical protein